MKLSKMSLPQLSGSLSSTQVTPHMQDLVNKQCEDREVRELELGTLSFMECVEVGALALARRMR